MNEKEERERLISKLQGARMITSPNLDLDSMPIQKLRLRVGLIEAMARRGEEAREQDEHD